MTAYSQATSTLPRVPKLLEERGVALWPETTEDAAFVERLYIANRWDEMAPTGWSDDEKLGFLKQQQRFQAIHYQTYYGDAARGIITAGGEAIGRLYLLKMAGDIRIVDISIMPEQRSRGVGTALIQAVFDQARADGSKVSIHVEQFNPARRLYDRLGFAPAGDAGIYTLMEWVPSSAA
jgi:ribosomal protein S18 acetylase RimI-like enzyme